MGLGERKSPSSVPTSEDLLLSVEGLNDVRTLLQGFFNILLKRQGAFDHHNHLPAYFD